jgi:hypothetical protein
MRARFALAKAPHYTVLPRERQGRPVLRFMANRGLFVRFFVVVMSVTVSFRLSRKGAPS